MPLIMYRGLDTERVPIVPSSAMTSRMYQKGSKYIGDTATHLYSVRRVGKLRIKLLGERRHDLPSFPRVPDMGRYISTGLISKSLCI